MEVSILKSSQVKSSQGFIHSELKIPKHKDHIPNMQTLTTLTIHFEMLSRLNELDLRGLLFY